MSGGCPHLGYPWGSYLDDNSPYLVKNASNKVRAIHYEWLSLILFADYIGDFHNKQSVTLYIKNIPLNKTHSCRVYHGILMHNNYQIAHKQLGKTQNKPKKENEEWQLNSTR